MRAITAIAGRRLRAGWRGWAALALLIGLAGGAVLAATAGARRTESAFPRFLRETNAARVLVGPALDGVRDGYDLAVGRLHGVTQIAPVVGLNSQPVLRNGKLDEEAEVVAPLDGRLGRVLERPRLLAGRQPRADRAGEVMVDQIAAGRLDLHVGSTLRLAALGNSPASKIRYLTVRVVGVEVLRDSIVPVNVLAQTAYIQATPALYRELGPDYQAFDGAYVQLAPGISVGQFTMAATALAREQRYAKTGGQIFVSDESVQDAAVERSIRPQAIALAIFALVLAITVLLVVGQAAVRLLLADSADNPVLAALGLTRWQLLAAGLLEVAVAVLAGALLAAAVAVAVSPLMPIGPARLAELHPGVTFDLAVLLPGCAAIVLLLLGRVGWTGWREASVRTGPPGGALAAGRGGSRVARWVSGSGAPVTVVTGIRLALEPGRGRRAGAGAGRHRGHRAVRGRGDGVGYLRHEPAAPGTDAPAVRPELGRGHGPSVRRGQGRAVRQAHPACPRHHRLDLWPARHRHAARPRWRHTRDRPRAGPRPAADADNSGRASAAG